jgi:hypothetical protein
MERRFLFLHRLAGGPPCMSLYIRCPTVQGLQRAVFSFGVMSRRRHHGGRRKTLAAWIGVNTASSIASVLGFFFWVKTWFFLSGPLCSSSTKSSRQATPGACGNRANHSSMNLLLSHTRPPQQHGLDGYPSFPQHVQSMMTSFSLSPTGFRPCIWHPPLRCLSFRRDEFPINPARVVNMYIRTPIMRGSADKGRTSGCIDTKDLERAA